MFRAPQLPRTLAAALRDLRDTHANVRTDAVRDLAKHGEAAPAEVQVALEKALEDPAAAVRAAATTALADTIGAAALDRLLAAADDRDASVREMALLALGEVGGAAAAPRLEKALADESAEARFQAVIAFPRVTPDSEAGIRAIENATRDPDALVAHIALRMAEEVGERAGEVDARLLRRARAMLGHDASTVRVAAAILLARGGDRSGDDVIAALARQEISTRDGEDEAAAIELCGELAIEAARPGLEQRAFGSMLSLRRDRFAWHARVSLARMGHERATREIVRELTSWDRDRRTLAVAAAGRARLQQAKPELIAMRDDGRADQGVVDEALRALSEAV